MTLAELTEQTLEEVTRMHYSKMLVQTAWDDLSQAQRDNWKDMYRADPVIALLVEARERLVLALADVRQYVQARSTLRANQQDWLEAKLVSETAVAYQALEALAEGA